MRTSLYFYRDLATAFAVMGLFYRKQYSAQSILSPDYGQIQRSFQCQRIVEGFLENLSRQP